MKITNSDSDSSGTSRAIDTTVVMTDASSVRTMASKRPGVGASSVRRYRHACPAKRAAPAGFPAGKRRGEPMVVCGLMLRIDGRDGRGANPEEIGVGLVDQDPDRESLLDANPVDGARDDG